MTKTTIAILFTVLASGSALGEPAAGTRYLAFASVQKGKGTCALFDLFRVQAEAGQVYVEYKVFGAKAGGFSRLAFAGDKIAGTVGQLEPHGGIGIVEAKGHITSAAPPAASPAISATLESYQERSESLMGGTYRARLGPATLVEDGRTLKGQATEGAFSWPTMPASFRFGHYRWLFLADSSGNGHTIYQADKLGALALDRGTGPISRAQKVELSTSNLVVEPTTKTAFPMDWHVKTADWDFTLTRQAIVAWVGQDEQGKPVPYSVMVVAGKGRVGDKSVDVGGCAEYFDD